MSSIFQCTGNESERMSICVDFTDNLILSYSAFISLQENLGLELKK